MIHYVDVSNTCQVNFHVDLGDCNAPILDTMLSNYSRFRQVHERFRQVPAETPDFWLRKKLQKKSGKHLKHLKRHCWLKTSGKHLKLFADLFPANIRKKPLLPKKPSAMTLAAAGARVRPAASCRDMFGAVRSSRFYSPGTKQFEL